MNTLNTRPQPGEAPKAGDPDLQSQLEELLDSVWESEANWRLDDKIDLATKTRPRRR